MKTHIKRISLSVLFSLFCVEGTTAQPADGIPAGTYGQKSGKIDRDVVAKGSTTFFEKFEAIRVTMKPSSDFKSNVSQADTEILMILLEGELVISLHGTEKTVGPGSIAFMMPGEKFNFKSKGPAVFYVFRSKSKLPMIDDRAKADGGSFIVDWKDAEEKKHERGSRRDFFNRATASCSKYEMHVTSLNKGLNSHAPHRHAEEEIILMINGSGAVRMDSTKLFSARAGEFVFIPSGVLHGLENTTKDGSCSYYAFQWKRED